MESKINTTEINVDLSQKPSNIQGRKVYVCFLPVNYTEQKVRQMFSLFGPIQHLRFNRRPDGFTYSYVTYQSINSARKAVNALHKIQLGDKVLKVSFAQRLNGLEITKEKLQAQKYSKNNLSKKQRKRGKQSEKNRDVYKIGNRNCQETLDQNQKIKELLPYVEKIIQKYMKKENQDVSIIKSTQKEQQQESKQILEARQIKFKSLIPNAIEKKEQDQKAQKKVQLSVIPKSNPNYYTETYRKWLKAKQMNDKLNDQTQIQESMQINISQ